MRTLLLCSLAIGSATCQAQSPVRFGPPTQSTSTSQAKTQKKDESSKARRLIQASLSRQPIVNVRIILSQRLYYNSSIFQQIKVEMSTDRKVHQIVLSPLSYAGAEGVDDGTTLRTYSPDEKEVIEQPSARQEGDDIPFRMNLIERNYSLRIDRKEKIAGREAIVVQAVPKDDDLETRCYSIDEKTGILLRLETCREGRAPMLHFDTKMVQFPTEFSEGTFRLDASFAKVEHFNRKCVSPEAADKLRDDLGFQPVIPSSLPYGFVPQELQASTDSRSPALIIRITDGLAKVTVLEWKRSGSKSGTPPAGTVTANSKSMTILVSGDLPDSEKERILKAFLSAVRAENISGDPLVATSWVQELLCRSDLFPFDRGCTGTAPIVIDMPVPFRIGSK